jgi:orotidine-5'-phosphate decarboxylase
LASIRSWVIMHLEMKFVEKLLEISRRNKSLLCVGLDPDPALMPRMNLVEFNKAIIDATKDLVCAYKPNFAFYEALGQEGIWALDTTINYIPDYIPVIGDAKRGDIGNTAKAYARAVLEIFDCDAVTVNPYLGFDSVEPFLKYEDKGIFILCRTSNKGARDFQDIKDAEGRPLFETVAQKALEWNTQGNIGLVVGATYPEELKKIRELCPEMPLLIPGVGTQGGDLELAIKYGVDAHGGKAIINVSRQVLYASTGTDFAEAARKNALELRDKINQFLPVR